MNRFFKITLGLVVLMTGLFSVSFAQDLTVDQIVEKANHAAYYQGQDGRAQVHMTITDSRDRTREREFTILRLDVDQEEEGGKTVDAEQKFYVYFHKPADVNKQVFMVWKHPGKDDDRWLYLPSLNLVKRIAASDERTSFAGSTFFYEDVSGRGIHEDNHELLETTDTYYILKSVPKEPDLVEFSEYKNYIHKDTFLPIQTEYFDRNGEKYRVYKVLEVKDIQDFKTVVKSQMQDLKGGGKTVMEYSSVTYNLGLPEEIFSERYLQNPPRQYLR